MQFVFGDNKSRYDLLYTDGDRNEANKILDMIRLPYTPNALFDTYGHVSFGTNSNRHLFFRCKRDDALSRGVYYLHGITHDTDKDSFAEQSYAEQIMVRFMEQETFNSLREQPEGFSYTPTLHEQLLNTDVETMELPADAFCAILIELYKKNRVTVVIEDERYSPELVLLLLRRIFDYLTPSLRKICSYIVALTDTGNTEFMLRILPASMYREDRSTCVRLFDYDGKSAEQQIGFPALVVNRVLEVEPGKRKRVFSIFETLYFGWESAYKKQEFEDYLRMLRAWHDLRQADTPEARRECEDACEIVVDHVVQDKRFTPSLPLPEIFRDILAPLYSDPAHLRQVMDYASFDVCDPMRYYDRNDTALWKIYLFADPSLSLVREALSAAFDATIDAACYSRLCDAEARYRRKRPAEDTMSAVERQFCAVIDAEMARLEQRLRSYEGQLKASVARMQRVVEQYDKYLPEAGHHPKILDYMVRPELERPMLQTVAAQENLSFREAMLSEGKRLLDARVRQLAEAKAEADRRSKERREAAFAQGLAVLDALLTEKEAAMAALTEKAKKPQRGKSASGAEAPAEATDAQAVIPTDEQRKRGTDALFRELLCDYPPQFEEQLAELVVRDFYYKRSGNKELVLGTQDRVAASIPNGQLLRQVARRIAAKEVLHAFAYVEKYAVDASTAIRVIVSLIANNTAVMESKLGFQFDGWWRKFSRSMQTQLTQEMAEGTISDPNALAQELAELCAALTDPKKCKKCYKCCTQMLELADNLRSASAGNP